MIYINTAKIVTKFINRFSRLGLIFVSIHFALVLLIPLWVKLFPLSCGFICIFSKEQGYFFLFNIPGWIIVYGTFIINILQFLKPEVVRLSGKITTLDNVTVFIFSSISYYLIGALMQFIRSGTKLRLKIKKITTYAKTTK